MPELWFYHLERTSLDQVLPGLLMKTLERGWRARVEVGSKERAEALSAQLWTFRDDAFLPHGTLTDGHAEAQPILLAEPGPDLNKADVLFVVETATLPVDTARLARFQRTMIIFDGQDATAKEQAREQWRMAKAADISVSYWQQSAEGRWEKKG
jgi:DNA polymerase-3 subunit chi